MIFCYKLCRKSDKNKKGITKCPRDRLKELQFEIQENYRQYQKTKPNSLKKT